MTWPFAEETNWSSIDVHNFRRQSFKPRTTTLACVASVSVRFWSKLTRNDIESKIARKMARIKEQGGVKKSICFLLQLLLLSFFASCIISRAAETENPVPQYFFALKRTETLDIRFINGFMRTVQVNRKVREKGDGPTPVSSRVIFMFTLSQSPRTWLSQSLKQAMTVPVEFWPAETDSYSLMLPR